MGTLYLSGTVMVGMGGRDTASCRLTRPATSRLITCRQEMAVCSAPIGESLDVSFDLAASEGQLCELFGQMCIKCEVQKCIM